MTTTKATLRRTGGSDTGYWVARCLAPECHDINGRPWQQMYSRRTIEGLALAEREIRRHNYTNHQEAGE